VSENDKPKDELASNEADTDPAEADSADAGPADPEPDSAEKPSGTSGPTFNEAPRPLDGITESAGNVWNSMEGKTVSMRTYIGTIIGVVVLMMLARCGG
jgi:hypothetical protein